MEADGGLAIVARVDQRRTFELNRIAALAEC